MALASLSFTARQASGDAIDTWTPEKDPDKVIVRVVPGVDLAQGHVPVFEGIEALVPGVAALNQVLSHWHIQGVRPAVSPQNRALGSRLGLDRYFVIDCPQASIARPLAEELRALVGIVEVAEVDEPMDALASRGEDDDRTLSFEIPDDPGFALQWSLENTGQTIRGLTGTNDADIDATEAWAITLGSESVVVAVLDAGISLSHPELQGQLVEGQNFTSTDPFDVDDSWVSHGTHIAGIIAARWGNDEGIAGLAPQCRVMPVRVVNRFGWTFAEWVSEGIIWATDHGASVMNISLGFPTSSSLLHDAIRYAFESDVVICASTGNIATNPIGFPAAYPETIAVGATDNNDELASFTSTGPELTLCAPGRDIYSLWDTNSMPDTYDFKSGTSFAAPHVAGVAALVRSINPTLSAPDVRRVLAVTCDDIGLPGRDPITGGAGSTRRRRSTWLLLSPGRAPTRARPT
ncbi:MAG: hypothetical protein Kow0022_10770 [Phycisphaerales bacterium]